MTAHPQRKSPRLSGYDYGQAGAYFVTICTRDKAHVFGRIADDAMVLSHAGTIAHEELARVPEYWPQQVELDLFVVMPNHVHVILVLVGTAFLPSLGKISSLSDASKTDTQKRVPTLGQVIGNYKAGVTRRLHWSGPIWQSRYHDHIIRNEADLDRIRAYVVNNPARWQADLLYSEG